MLQGTIHPNTTLFHLPNLQRLNLAYNDFTDSQLPREIGRLSNSLTHLNLSECGIAGEIPAEILLLTKLVSLDLSWNFVSRIQPYLLNILLRNSIYLRELLIPDVQTGWVLPAYLNISSSLKSLNLHNTGLQGKLPQNIFGIQYLEKLDLGFNFINGPMPKVVINQSSLKSLKLSGAQLKGNIPDSIFNLQHLEVLDLAWNYDMTGPLPKVNKNTNIPLKFMDLSSLNLSGEIPYSFGHLKSLNHLDLSSCGLVGSLPKSFINLRHLTSLDLSFNKLNGVVPSFLFTLPSIEIINFHDNMFSGGLPSELLMCQSLNRLSLSNNRFDGEINQGSTRPLFVQLTNLTYLDLSRNNFTGLWELDTWLSGLPKLQELYLSYSGLSVVTSNATYYYVNPGFRHLELASCKLTVFPYPLRAMKNLTRLDLSYNSIQGRIPHWAGEIGGDWLSSLNLSHNYITGLPQLQWAGLRFLILQSNLIEGPIPPSFCNMSKLVLVDMSDNRFDGVIPRCVGNLSNNFGILDLSNNQFRGTIPDEYGDYCRLGGLILNGNQLEGEIPTSLAKCQYLQLLDLGNNHLNGTFPGWLGNLRELQVLILKSNRIHGAIKTFSTVKYPFPQLQVLDLSHNRFVGHLPQKYFQNFNAMKGVLRVGTKPEYLEVGSLYYSIILVVKGQQLAFAKILVDYDIVDLSNNKFEGEIPNLIGALSSLIALNLSHNNLHGRIPYALGNLSEIESLDLSWNQLTEEIPQSIADLTFLEVLNVSQNHLHGRIPNGKQFLTFDESSFGGNPGLCGFPLSKHCEHEHQSSPQIEGEDDGDEEESGFTVAWNVVMLGFGCGTLIGLVIGFFMLSTGRPKWFSEIADSAEHIMGTKRNKRRIIYIGK